MERLRDQAPSQDPVAREMARLLRLAKAPDPPLGVERRIRAAVLAAARRPRRTLVLRYAVALVLVLAMTAVAGAWVVHVVTERRREAERIAAAARTKTKTPKVVRDTTPPSAAPTILPAVVPDPARAAPPARGERPAPAPARAISQPLGSAADSRELDDETGSPSAARPAPEPLPSAASLAAEPRQPAAPLVEGPQAALVLEAVRALHRDHDPRQCLRLLEHYLRDFPNGTLVEEALALSIEAHVTLGDHAVAQAAQAYLDRFPYGRFAELARRARNGVDR